MSGKNSTRTFTEEETNVLVAALLAYRNVGTVKERKIADGIIRDGWK